MNVFTTEHPINSQPSFFDTRAYPVSSFVWSSLAIALLLLPFVVGFCAYDAFSYAAEIGAETELPDSWALFTAQAFAVCLFFGSLVVVAYRLLEWYFESR